MRQPLQHVSLFSGVGGIDLAAHRAGIPTVAACEIDRAARGVIADRSPGTHLFIDVKEVTGAALRTLGLVPERTLLSAGFPCQDLSVAGRRRGMVEGSGTRSALYWEVDRLLAEFAPAWVILENVPGLLSSRGGRDMGTVLASLGQRGYGFAYRVLDARHFGVPQRRRRVVIVGRLGDDGRAPAQVLLEPEGVPGNPAARVAPRQVFARRAASGARARGVAFHMTQNPISGPVSPALGVSSSGMGVGYVAPCVTALDTAQGGPDDNSAQGGHLIATYQKVIRSGVRDGDGSLPPEVWDARDVAATLSPFDLGSEGRSVDLAVEDHGGELIVRRLTPTECERLQGFPDGHTATSNGKAQADSPRYKQMGNAVAVPVFEWVTRRIAAVDALSHKEAAA